MRDRAGLIEFVVALLLDALGGAAVLLIANRSWQTITVARPRPLADEVLAISGRTVDAASTALSLVALAGVVAVLATRGLARTVVGALVALSGALVVWRSLAALPASSAPRARSLVHDQRPNITLGTGSAVHVATDPSWAVLSAVGGGLILAGGVIVALRGRRWVGLSSRYQRDPGARGSGPAAGGGPSATPETVGEVDAEAARTRTSVALWRALDRGDDPTTAGDSEVAPPG